MSTEQRLDGDATKHLDRIEGQLDQLASQRPSPSRCHEADFRAALLDTIREGCEDEAHVCRADELHRRALSIAADDAFDPEDFEHEENCSTSPATPAEHARLTRFIMGLPTRPRRINYRRPARARLIGRRIRGRSRCRRDTKSRSSARSGDGGDGEPSPALRRALARAEKTIERLRRELEDGGER